MKFRRRTLCAAIPMLLAVFSVAYSAIFAPRAEASKRPATGFADSLYFSGDPAVRDTWLSKTRRAGGSYARLSIDWAAVAAQRPLSARDPDDIAYDWSALDGAVRSARSRGLRVLVTVSKAPAWAEGPNRPGSAPPGSWKPNAADLGDFGHAIAERYSGGVGAQPQIQALQAWNEPNLSTYLTPQYEGKRNVSAAQYKRMLNAFYAGVKSSNRQIKVVTGGTAPYGDPAGGSRSRPLTFWRKVFCLNGGQRKLKPGKCKTKPKLDVLAHHPINTSGGPKRSAINPNDASTPDFKQVRRILRAAEKGRNISPGGRHGLWATELWWDSRPPSRDGVSLKTQARYYRQALPLLARQGAQVVIGLTLRDFGQQGARGSGSGLYTQSGEKKPAFSAWRTASR